MATLRTPRGAFTEESGFTSSSLQLTLRLSAAFSRRISFPAVYFAALSSSSLARLYCSTSTARILSIGRWPKRSMKRFTSLLAFEIVVGCSASYQPRYHSR